MGKRRRAREVVLQALYEAEFSDVDAEEIFRRQIDRRQSGEETEVYARELFLKTLADRQRLDDIIAGALEHWDMERVALIDKNILRFSLAEIIFFDQVPAKVIIDEAVEIAHRYSSAEAGRFVNGLLDRFVKEYRKGAV